MDLSVVPSIAFENELDWSQFEARASVLMDSQKQSCHSKRTVDAVSETELCKTWKVPKKMAVYEIKLQQDVDNQVEPAPSLDQQNGVGTRRHRRFPSGNTRPQIQLPPLAKDISPSPSISSESDRQTKMLIPLCGHFNEDMRSTLKLAVSHPPVNTSTLMELDLNWILHNINLRSDINFDTDLHFMPVKGKRAEQKRKEAQEYWLALAAELQIHLHTRLQCTLSGGNEWACAPESFTPRLPQMFADLRELLETLVPDRDHVSIAGNLEVPFLMQQIENGVLDIPRLSKWLASLLKSHCAPMRDEWTDQMTQQIEEGSQRSDMISLVGGIEKLFSVLEAMKLVRPSFTSFENHLTEVQDVANHQIRTFRLHLMEDTINFQQRFFAQRIMDGKIDVGSCRVWYDRARQLHTSWLLSTNTAPNQDASASLIHGMTAALLSMPDNCVMPKSFQCDLKRLERLRSDMQDLIHLKMGLRVFDELHFWLASGQANPVSPNAYTKLQSRILAIVDEQPDDVDPWQISSADVALEITRAACTLCGYSEEAIPDCVIQSTYHRLNELICGQTSECALICDSSRAEFASRAIHHAQTFAEMTPLAISESQQHWQQQQQEQKTSFRRLPDVEDIARRLAHVGILHWRIWANLVYLDDAEEAPAEQPTLINPSSYMQRGERRDVISDVHNCVGMLVE